MGSCGNVSNRRFANLLCLAGVAVVALWWGIPAFPYDPGGEPGETKSASPEPVPDRASVPAAARQPVPGGADDPASARQPGRPHRAHMKLSGSSCLSCLAELERKLKTIEGIHRVKIERPGLDYYQFYGAAGSASSYVEATIVYDPAQAPLPELKAFLRTQGYHAFKIVDSEEGEKKKSRRSR